MKRVEESRRDLQEELDQRLEKDEGRGLNSNQINALQDFREKQRVVVDQAFARMKRIVGEK